MALTPRNSGEVESTGSTLATIAGGIVGAIILFFVAKWIIGFVFGFVKFGIFLAIVVGIIYLARQFSRSD